MLMYYLGGSRITGKIVFNVHRVEGRSMLVKYQLDVNHKF